MGCGDIGDWFKSLGIYGYLLVGVFIAIAAYLIILHQEHLAAYSGVIFIILFIGLHLVVCGRGHGSHGDHGGGCCGGGSHEGLQEHKDKEQTGEKDGAGPGTGTGKDNADKEQEKGGSCH